MVSATAFDHRNHLAVVCELQCSNLSQDFGTLYYCCSSILFGSKPCGKLLVRLPDTWSFV